MKSMIAVLTLVVLTFAPGIAVADDEEDIIAAVLDYISGWNDGDAAKVAQYMLPDATAFQQGNNLAAAPFNQAALQSNMDNGTSFNLQFRNMKVQVYGDTAVFTAYEVGNIAFANGFTNSGPWRYTAVLVKQDGVWKQAHRHASPLRTGDLGQ